MAQACRREAPQRPGEIAVRRGLGRIDGDRLAAGRVSNGCVHVRTLEQARDLAFHLAQGCEEPDAIAIGLTELMINAIEHGNLGIGPEQKAKLLERGLWQSSIERRLRMPEHAGKFVSVSYRRDGTSMQVRIRDRGEGFDPAPHLAFHHERRGAGHGYGIAVAGASGFETLRFIEPGNLVEVTARLEAETPRSLAPGRPGAAKRPDAHAM